MSFRVILTVSICAIVALLVHSPSYSADFPTKPVRLVIPYSPGGSHDAHARAFASVMEPYLGKPMLAVIRSGGGGSIGSELCRQAARLGASEVIVFDHSEFNLY